MPQSHSAVFVHGVFSTKQRVSFLSDPQVRAACHTYIAAVSKGMGCIPVIVGGVADHVHILSTLDRTCSQSDWMKKVKQASSGWMKEHVRDFSWQAGYGVFSVGREQIDAVRRYIENQEEHHREKTYQEEYREFLIENGIEIDERYLWD